MDAGATFPGTRIDSPGGPHIVAEYKGTQAHPFLEAMSKNPVYSVIIPAFNEEGTVAALLEAVRGVMDGMGEPYEIVFVDDHSEDGTLAAAHAFAERHSGLRLLHLKQRCGKSGALQVGFDAARGRIFLTLDADFQNDPADFPRLVAKMQDGYDVVCGWRKDRQDHWFKKVSSKTANYARRILMGDRVHDVGCAIRAFKREAVAGICFTADEYRFFTYIVRRLGARVTDLVVTDRPRRYGVSKYNLRNRLPVGLVDLVRLGFGDLRVRLRRSPERMVPGELVEVRRRPEDAAPRA